MLGPQSLNLIQFTDKAKTHKRPPKSSATYLHNPKMPISILPPRDAYTDKFAEFSRPDEYYEGEEEDEDMEGDIAMGDSSTKKRGAGGRMPIVTPGEVVTSDPQWMRGHGTYLAETDEGETGTSIVATVAGSVTKTNKLLSVKPLRARYTPDIGDLVVGRIMEVCFAVGVWSWRWGWGCVGVGVGADVKWRMVKY